MQYHFISAASYGDNSDSMKSLHNTVIFWADLISLVTLLAYIPALDFPLKKGRQQITLAFVNHTMGVAW